MNNDKLPNSEQIEDVPSMLTLTVIMGTWGLFVSAVTIFFARLGY
jgi:hypothetical protein